LLFAGVMTAVIAALSFSLNPSWILPFMFGYVRFGDRLPGHHRGRRRLHAFQWSPENACSATTQWPFQSLTVSLQPLLLKCVKGRLDIH
jgi:hypothetical protein